MGNGIRKLLFIILLMGLFCLVIAEERFIARISNPDSGDVEYLQKNSYDIAGGNPGAYIDLVVTRDQFDRLRSSGFSIRIEKTEAEVLEDLSATGDRPIAGYREYEEILTDLQQYVADHPDICRLYDIGDTQGKLYSADGHTFYDDFDHEIWALKVSDNPDNDEDEPAIYYFGAHHSREPLSTEVCMTVLDHVVTSYGTDTQITNDVDTKEIWFVPIVNPNGVKIVLDQTDVWWRKNIRDNNNNHDFDSDYETGTGDDGVDPNRNYGFVWGNVGSTDNPNGSTYHGPEEFSEPETQAVRDLIRAHHFVAGISYHTHGELVLIPYGYAENIYAPDDAALVELGELVAENIDALGNGHYTPQYSYALYPTMGGLDDWAYGEQGVFAYTVELATEFIPPQNQVGTICNANIDGAMQLLRRIDNSTITGHITDAETGQPMVAEVFIEGIDNTGEYRDPITSDEQFGTYYRMVLPGAYNVTYSAYGFESQTVIVVVSDLGMTTQDIALEPAASIDFNGIVRDATTFAPLAGAQITLGGAPFEPITSDEYGIFEFEDVAMGTYTITITAEGYGLTQKAIDLNASNQQLFYMYEPFMMDDMESGNSNWNMTGTWALTTSQYHSANHSITDSPSGNYGNNVTTYCELANDINLYDATMASVSFYAKYALEADYDYVYLQVHGADGWVNLDAFTGESDWTLKEYNLTNYVGNSDVSLRFYLMSDTYLNEDGFYLDDFKIYSDYALELNYGDVDDSETVTAQDASYILQYAAGLDPLDSIDPRPWTDTRTVAADVDGNGLVTAYDASLVQRFVDGAIDGFPVDDSDVQIDPCEVSIRIENGAFIFSTEDELFGLDVTCWVTDDVSPGSPEALAEGVWAYEYIGDVVMKYSMMSTNALDGDFLRIPFVLLHENPDDFTFDLNVNASSIEYVVDMDPSAVVEIPEFTDQLLGNFPNPFNPTTNIRFSLSQETPVDITIYNIRGQKVKKLTSERYPAGVHQVTWYGQDDYNRPVASGIYLYRYQAGKNSETRKALLLK